MSRRALFTAIVMLAPALAFASTSGCGGHYFGPDEGGSLADAGFQPTPKKDAGPLPEAGPILECCGQCDAIDATAFPWKPPTTSPGSCSDADVAAMVAFIDGTPSATFKQLQDSIESFPCRDCVFAKETGTWAPIVLDSTGANMVALNLGGCPAIFSGKDECGRAIQQWNDCLYEACAYCPDGDQDAGTKCVEASNKKACSRAFADVFTGPACGGATAAQAALDACNKPEDKYTFVGGVRAQCVGLSDAGDGG